MRRINHQQLTRLNCRNNHFESLKTELGIGHFDIIPNFIPVVQNWFRSDRI